MPIRLLSNASSPITQGISPSATTVTPKNHAFVTQLNTVLDIGDVLYLVLADATRTETVAYTHTALISETSPTITIVRGQLGTTAKTWGVGTCMTSTLTEGILNALICQKIRQGC
jgi:hypothetical protein